MCIASRSEGKSAIASDLNRQLRDEVLLRGSAVQLRAIAQSITKAILRVASNRMLPRCRSPCCQPSRWTVWTASAAAERLGQS